MYVYVHVFMCTCTHIQIKSLDGYTTIYHSFSECQDSNDCSNPYLALTMCQALSTVQITIHLGLMTTQ